MADGWTVLVERLEEIEIPRLVAAVLAEGRAEGLTFEQSWYRAMRAISIPRNCPAELRDDVTETRQILRECKPVFRCAYVEQPVAADVWATLHRSAEARLAA